MQFGDATGKSTRVVFAWTIREGDEEENAYEVEVLCEYAKRKGVPTHAQTPSFSKQMIQAMASSATAAASRNQHVIDAGARLLCKYQALLQLDPTALNIHAP